MIEFKNVTFSYNKVPALKNLNLKINSGEYVSVIGPNGSGKSTLSLLLNGLLKPDKGQVIIDNLSTSSDKTAIDVKQKVGLLFQNPDNQIVATIVEEDIAFGPENLGLCRQEITKRVEESLDAVGMTSFSRHEPHMLSDGQRQKVAIASVLAMKPSYLVLDEPSSYLDEASRHSLVDLLNKLNNSGLTIINITHFTEQILASERVIALKDAQLVFDGSLNDFMNNKEAHSAVGFKKPLWVDIKERYRDKYKQLQDIDSLDRLEEVLCSLK